MYCICLSSFCLKFSQWFSLKRQSKTIQKSTEKRNRKTPSRVHWQHLFWAEKLFSCQRANTVFAHTKRIRREKRKTKKFSALIKRSWCCDLNGNREKYVFGNYIILIFILKSIKKFVLTIGYGIIKNSILHSCF